MIRTTTMVALGALSLLVLAPASLACDPNDPLPGALPPAPNGGWVSEAALIQKTEAKKELEGGPNFYWEGLHSHSERQVELFLLSIVPPKVAVFTKLSPAGEVNDIRVKVELPREGKIFQPPFSIQADRVVVSFDHKDRFIVHVEGIFKDGARKASVQIEED